MTHEIIFTVKARETFLATVSFIKEKWGDKSANDFVKRSNKVFQTISKQPYIFQTFLNEDIRKGIITKQTSFFYKIVDHKIEILLIWDNRQDPIIL